MWYSGIIYMAYYNRIRWRMISNLLRMLCVAAFLGILLFSIAQSTNTQSSAKKSQGFINYKSVTERRTVQTHQSYAPNIIYLGDNNPQNSGLVKLRSRTR